MNEGLTERVEAIKRFARDHYEDEDAHWDIIVETYEDGEIVELLTDRGWQRASVPLDTVLKGIASLTNVMYERGGGGSENW